MIPKWTNVLLKNKNNKQKKLCVIDNFQMARVKIKRQKSIFLYNRIQIEKMFTKLEANLRLHKTYWQKNIF